MDPNSILDKDSFREGYRRCPFCGALSTPKQDITPPMEAAWECGTYLMVEIVQSQFCRVRVELVQARAEAVRYRQKYEALRTEVEQVACQYRQKYEALRTEVEQVACQVRNKAWDAWDAWEKQADPHERGRAHGLEQAEHILRALLLDEAGGGGDGTCR